MLLQMSTLFPSEIIKINHKNQKYNLCVRAKTNRLVCFEIGKRGLYSYIQRSLLRSHPKEEHINLHLQ